MKEIFERTNILPIIESLKYEMNDRGYGNIYDLKISDNINIIRDKEKCKFEITREVTDSNSEALDIYVKIKSFRILKDKDIDNREILNYLKNNIDALKREARLVSITISQITLNSGFGGIVTMPLFEEPKINITTKQDD